MSLPSFQLHIPCTTDEAISLAKRFDGDSAFMAGGTDLLNNYADDLDVKTHVIALSKIRELKALSGSLIGSGVTIAELIDNQAMLPSVIGETARLIAGPALRNVATVGGNLLLAGRCVYFNRSKLYRCSHGACMKAEGQECITVPQSKRCYAPISGDLAPVLLVLDARFVIAGPSGARVVAARDFYRTDGIYSNVLGPAEILVQVLLPDDVHEVTARYLKLRSRSAMDFPEAGVAVAVKRNEGIPVELRVALGALGPAPTLAVRQTGELSQCSTDELAERLWKEMSTDVFAVRNTSLQPGYRREMAQLFIRRLLKELLK
ncbi:MAG: FAD binding domain-containing protein [Candidatus Melainabacteria bacterium]|nr:FAD binding domain-containing protein [Candidatus Melainabacteria bacterium]